MWNTTKKSADDLPLGKEDHVIGFAPDSLTFHATTNMQQNALGNQVGYKTTINTRLIDAHVFRMVENRANAFVNERGRPPATPQEIDALNNMAMAIVLAHEIGFHGIAGNTDWYMTTPMDWDGNKDNDGFVDSRIPRIDFNTSKLQFSKQACKEIADELDID